MADTVRTKAEILSLFPDNTSGAISPQDLRDFVVSTWRAYDGVYAYVSAPADTTCATADTFYFLNGEFSNEIMECWEIAPPLTYLGCDGNDGYKFKVDVHAAVTSDTGDNLIKLALYKNGELQNNSVMSTYIKFTFAERMVSLVDVLTFNIGDTVEIRVSSSKAGAVVTAQKLTTSLNRFF